MNTNEELLEQNSSGSPLTVGGLVVLTTLSESLMLVKLLVGLADYKLHTSHSDVSNKFTDTVKN
ncbi:unnamed protein product [Timema podura]|uniref:Uncharacterized protein n=1 Tax=Timema podura TaxID=61482 RepID=A0ABN7PBC5_TIMPD|nr:unnamed protein product [Timema podura]